MRAIFVEAQVSSMNTRRSGSRSGWLSNHAHRWFRMSGRSCSVACAVFFARDPMTVEEAPDRADACRHASPRELGLDLRQRDVGLLFEEVEDQGRMGLDPRRAAITPERPGRNRTGFPRQRAPADRA
jgi:hypothetical protein